MPKNPLNPQHPTTTPRDIKALPNFVSVQIRQDQNIHVVEVVFEEL